MTSVPNSVPSASISPTDFASAAAAGTFLFEQSDVTTDDVLEEVPAGAEIDKGIIFVTAKPGGDAQVAKVAVVRETQLPAPTSTWTEGSTHASAFVIDFQRMRTVSRVYSPNMNLHAVVPWVGTAFADADDYKVASPTSDYEFPEIQTERLLVVVKIAPTGAVPNPPAPTLEQFLAATRVTLPVPPSDLELLVNGKRVWFRPGPVRPEVSPNITRHSSDFFKISVDLTAELALAAKAGPNVRVTLKSSVPGLLDVTHDVTFKRVHTVVFPEGEVRNLVTDSEGLTKLALPVPATGTDNWTILEVRLTAGGEIPAVRVQPASGPDAAQLGDVELALDAEHTIAVRLPATQLDAFGTLSGVRFPVFTGPDGAEVAGVLYADASGQPGEIISGPSLGPLSVEKLERGGSAQPRYVSLLLPRPRKVDKQTPLWVAIQVSRGTLFWPAIVLPGAQPPDNPLYQGPPSGPFKKVPSIQIVSTPPGQPKKLTVGGNVATRLGGVVRIVGESAADQPIPALTAWIDGSNKSVTFTPNASGVPVVVPVTPAQRGNRAQVISQGAVQVQLQASTAGTFTFRSVDIVYR